MDGAGRARDNLLVERLWRTVKYEEVYLQDYRSRSAELTPKPAGSPPGVVKVL